MYKAKVMSGLDMDVDDCLRSFSESENLGRTLNEYIKMYFDTLNERHNAAT